MIVDWHILNPGDPYYNLTRAKTFFADIASRYKNQDNILYETANEPHGVSWDRIRAYHELIIPVIRSRDPQAVILLGTRGYSSLGVAEGSSEIEIINNPVRAKNVMYTFHFYAASHRDNFLNTLSSAASNSGITWLPESANTWRTPDATSVRATMSAPRCFMPA